MSNEVKVTQEMWNRVLDVIDKVSTLEKSLTETRTHLRNTQLANQSLKIEIDKATSANQIYGDVFKDFGKKK